MPKKIRRLPSKQFSVAFPLELMEEIDTICASTFLSRSAWVLMAAREKIARDRERKKIEMMERLSKE
jgi:metal-responsive CopG/Arc/MetJ family transcriptional regulator